MSYIIESKQDAVIQSVLLTTKQTFATTKSSDQPSNRPTLTKKILKCIFKLKISDFEIRHPKIG